MSVFHIWKESHQIWKIHPSLDPGCVRVGQRFLMNVVFLLLILSRCKLLCLKLSSRKPKLLLPQDKYRTIMLLLQSRLHRPLLSKSMCVHAGRREHKPTKTTNSSDLHAGSGNPTSRCVWGVLYKINHSRNAHLAKTGCCHFKLPPLSPVFLFFPSHWIIPPRFSPCPLTLLCFYFHCLQSSTSFSPLLFLPHVQLISGTPGPSRAQSISTQPCIFWYHPTPPPPHSHPSTAAQHFQYPLLSTLTVELGCIKHVLSHIHLQRDLLLKQNALGSRSSRISAARGEGAQNLLKAQSAHSAFIHPILKSRFNHLLI